MFELGQDSRINLSGGLNPQNDFELIFDIPYLELKIEAQVVGMPAYAVFEHIERNEAAAEFEVLPRPPCKPEHGVAVAAGTHPVRPGGDISDPVADDRCRDTAEIGHDHLARFTRMRP